MVTENAGGPTYLASAILSVIYGQSQFKNIKWKITEISS